MDSFKEYTLGFNLDDLPKTIEPRIERFKSNDLCGFVSFDPDGKSAIDLDESTPTVSHVDAHLYTEIDSFGYYFIQGLTCDPTKRV